MRLALSKLRDFGQGGVRIPPTKRTLKFPVHGGRFCFLGYIGIPLRAQTVRHIINIIFADLQLTIGVPALRPAI